MNELRTDTQNFLHTEPEAGEKDFELFLPAVVSGINAEGKEFSENTELTSISAVKAQFGLKSKVTIGTKLNVILSIPKTLILENYLKLRVSGDVVFAKSDIEDSPKHLISIRLDRMYKIQAIKN